MEEPKQIRDVNRLNGVVRELLKLALVDMKKQGITPLVVETVRTQERQYWLYGQGRSALQLMKKKIPIKYAHKGAIVTQTVNSIHIQGCAVDVIPMRDNKAIWDSNDKDTKAIIQTMEKYGFEAGANWTSFKDSPHFQIKLPIPSYNSVSSQNTTTFLTRAIQRKLGFTGKDVDGIWGGKTDEAVKNFRALYHLDNKAVLYADNIRLLFS